MTSVALSVLVGVLLAALLLWARKRWMGYTINVTVCGKPYPLTSESFSGFVSQLMKKAGCSESWAKAVIRRGATKPLELAGAWVVLAEMEGMTLAEYVSYAVDERIITKLAQIPASLRTDELVARLRQRAAESMPKEKPPVK